MNVADFLSPDFVNQPHFMVGQILLPDEAPARDTGTLTLAQQRALLFCLSGERLDFNGRQGWRHAKGGAVRIEGRTVECLAALDLLTIRRTGTRKATARLTVRGNLYARTISTERIAAANRAIAAARAKP